MTEVKGAAVSSEVKQEIKRVDFEGEELDVDDGSSARDFALPAVFASVDARGWGPPSGFSPAVQTLIESGIPYAPFNKSERLGRISDWSQTDKSQGDRRARQSAPGSNSAFSYKHEEDEESFSVVDNKPKKNISSRGGRGRGGMRGRFTPRPFIQRGRGRGGQRGRGGRGGQFQRGGRWGYNNQYGDQKEQRDPSVHISEDWKLVQKLEFKELAEASTLPSKVETLLMAGSLDPFNVTIEHTTPKNAKPLARFDKRQHFTATTSADPVLQRLAQQKKGNVYSTDTILALLMACDRSVAPWDVVFRKDGDNVFIDKRPNSRIDLHTVNENWNEVLQQDKESVNSARNLSNEATWINQNFSQQVLVKDKSKQLDEKNPFTDSLETGMEPASIGYRYRRFTLSDKINLVARTSVNALYEEKGKDTAFLTVRALNEFDSKLQGNVDWRQKLETQTGAVLATEMKNNSCKLTRWAAETLLCGADELKLGFVTRQQPRDNSKHLVLMTKRYKPLDFAKTVNVKVNHMWGVLRQLIELVQQQDDGKYLLLKDPNANAMFLYAVPNTAFLNETGDLDQDDNDGDYEDM